MSSPPRILATLGPASLDDDIIRRMTAEDVHLFRLNLSHTDPAVLESQVELIRRSTTVRICLDTEGAQIRNQYMRDGQVEMVEGSVVRIAFEEVLGDAENISFTPGYVARQLAVGDRIRIDFHAACIRVIETHPTHCVAIVEAGGRVGSNKAADVDREIELEALTPKDRHCITVGRRLGIRDYALSFAQSQQTVRNIRELAGPDSRIIAKIESRRGLRNLVPILAEADDILIDRGDLSREVAIEKVPLLQRRIIAVARSKAKPVHVATNLLESMVSTSSATRAEVNDVISTLEMGASGLVLAAETAIGRYPYEAVAAIRRLIEQYERWTPYTTIADLLEDDHASTPGSGGDAATGPAERRGDAATGIATVVS